MIFFSFSKFFLMIKLNYTFKNTFVLRKLYPVMTILHTLTEKKRIYLKIKMQHNFFFHLKNEFRVFFFVLLYM